MIQVPLFLLGQKLEENLLADIIDQPWPRSQFEGQRLYKGVMGQHQLGDFGLVRHYTVFTTYYPTQAFKS
ncbi:hypothetical protein SBV1_1500027 [Verrucomicrobia bacterium]|nr:hypothetical protein SBV1_1500027 [Verrucomicrobiota bacterium]